MAPQGSSLTTDESAPGVSATADTLREPPAVSNLTRLAKGRFPAELVVEHPELLTRPKRPYIVPTYAPELHPLDGEWYFTADVADWLARTLDGLGRTLVLGAPTVALRMTGPRVLVDSNPYLDVRLPELAEVDFRVSRVQDVEFSPEFDAAILDPPWYFPGISDWLAVAATAVRRGGTILMPLLLDLTRPTAVQDRARIMALFQRLGEVHVTPLAIEYEVPLFESRALSASGIVLSEPWRGADLISVRLPTSGHRSLDRHAKEAVAHRLEWATYVFGSQMVKVRRSGEVEGDLVTPVPGVVDFTLDTVSMRDSRIREVSIWTSRNRVAGSGDLQGLHRAMKRIAATGDVSTEADVLAYLLEAD